jgi:Ni/Co efflux regulator RcnB
MKKLLAIIAASALVLSSLAFGQDAAKAAPMQKKPAMHSMGKHKAKGHHKAMRHHKHHMMKKHHGMKKHSMMKKGGAPMAAPMKKK